MSVKIRHLMCLLGYQASPFTHMHTHMHTHTHTHTHTLVCCSDFSCIMVPLQSSLTVTLPAGLGSSAEHNAFPGFQPTIDRFEDKVISHILNEPLRDNTVFTIIKMCRHVFRFNMLSIPSVQSLWSRSVSASNSDMA